MYNVSNVGGKNVSEYMDETTEHVSSTKYCVFGVLNQALIGM